MKIFNSWFINILNEALSSTTGLYIALIVPIIVIWMPNSIKQIENILSSNWLQLWALFALAIIAKRGNDQHKDNSAKLAAIHKHLGVKDGR